MTREDVITGLREAADFIETHPDLEIDASFRRLDLSVAVGTAKELGDAARQLGQADKQMSDTFAEVSREIGGLVRFGAYARRGEVCEAKVVGTREVEKPIMEQTGTEIVEEDIIEWECEPLLAD